MAVMDTYDNSSAPLTLDEIEAMIAALPQLDPAEAADSASQIAEVLGAALDREET